MIARLLARIRGFHGDRRAQILPLVFFVGIAFFTSTVLVINTGRTVTRRMQAQNAVDAAAVSGATAIARGMNYISSNNITMSKLLATVVILRAFDPAIEEARVALEVWLAVAVAMDAAGVALEATLFGAAAGAALQAIAFAIETKVNEMELPILDAIQPVIKDLVSIWDDNGNGVAWIVLKVLAKLGDGLAYVSPLIAQYTAKSVYEADLPGSSKWTDVWMLPLYPAMPACKGKFGDFVDKVTHYAEIYEKPIIIAGWVLLTLSMFPLFYEAQVKVEIEKLFTGGGTADTPTDPDAVELKKKQDELKALQDQATKKDAEIKEYDAQITAVDNHVDPGPHDSFGRDPTALRNKRTQLKFELQNLEDQIDAKQAEIKTLSDKRLNEGGGSSEGHPATISDPTGGKPVKDNKDVYPYMIDGKDWPKSFTYFTVAWSKVPTPLPPTKYDLAGRKFEVFTNPIGTNVVYAAARVVNPVEADLWTPAWRARLVRATAATIPTNPVGHLPSTCGEEGADAGSDVPDDGGSPPDGEKTKSVLEKIVGFLSKH